MQPHSDILFLEFSVKTLERWFPILFRASYIWCWFRFVVVCTRHSITKKPQRSHELIAFNHCSNSRFIILAGLKVWRVGRVWWEVMMWKAVLEEVLRVRGERDSCHAAIHASHCWMDIQRPGVGGSGAPSPPSCHGPVTQCFIMPPHLLIWMMDVWSTSRRTPPTFL